MKAIVIALLVLTLGAGGVFAAGPLGDEASTDRTIPLATAPESSTSSTTTTTETGDDVPGPCDEPEHANDPRCGGVATGGGGATTTVGTTTVGTTTTETGRGRDAREPGEDVRGPCDEAEHANDPRCTGGVANDDDGRRGGDSGPGGSGSSGGGASGSDGSGPSGPGRSGSDDDPGSSGRGGGSDDSDDDSRSGSNSGSG